jgi:glucan-binding YG repeat protein/beta-lactamase superfamily II metal-dependent hydrolase
MKHRIFSLALALLLLLSALPADAWAEGTDDGVPASQEDLLSPAPSGEDGAEESMGNSSDDGQGADASLAAEQEAPAAPEAEEDVLPAPADEAPLPAPEKAPPAPESDGWHQGKGGTWYYIRGGERLRDTAEELGGSLYAFDAEGVMRTDVLLDLDGVSYYFGADGTGVPVVVPGASACAPGNRLWFFNIAGGGAVSGDLILVESAGRWGLIDTGHRYADTITAADGTVYAVPMAQGGRTVGLSSQISGKNGRDAAIYMIRTLGVRHLDFILGTHAHSDHIGGIPEIAELLVYEAGSAPHSLVDSSTVFLHKAYRHVSNQDDDLAEQTSYSWHNQAFSYQAEQAVRSRGGTVVDLSCGVVTGEGQQTVPDQQGNIAALSGVFSDVSYDARDRSDYFDDRLSLRFGELRFCLYNLFSVAGAKDENVNSIAAVITDGSSTVFSGGDLDAQYRTEQKIARAVSSDFGHMDAIKANHHGANFGSQTKEFLDLLQPGAVVRTHACGDVDGTVPSGSYAAAKYYARKNFGTIFYQVGAAERAIALEFQGGGLAFHELRGSGENMVLASAEGCVDRSLPADGWCRWDIDYLTGPGRDWLFFRNGQPATGWLRSGQNFYWLDTDGFMYRGWKTLESKTYYFSPRAADTTPEGAMVTGWREIGGMMFLFAPSGELLTASAKDNLPTTWLYHHGGWYYIDGARGAVTGWLYLNSTWYYLDASGAMQTGWVKVGGSWYYLNASGAMQTGWLKDGGSWYYLGSDGAMQTGWLKDGGNWYYLGSDGAMRTGWLKAGGNWYYMDASGAMQTGWLKDGGSWYYLNAGGAMRTGWVKVGGSWYYLNASGAMQTGWLKDGGSWYYLNAGGVMQTGWIQSGGSWYYMDASGVMQTGWIQSGGSWYYLQPNGTMAAGTTLTIDGQRYRFDGGGRLVG